MKDVHLSPGPCRLTSTNCPLLFVGRRKLSPPGRVPREVLVCRCERTSQEVLVGSASYLSPALCPQEQA